MGPDGGTDAGGEDSRGGETEAGGAQERGHHNSEGQAVRPEQQGSRQQEWTPGR